jgi:hypothetical protein
MFVCITLQEVSKQVVRRWMGAMQKMSFVEEGESRSKWYFIPTLVTTIVLGAPSRAQRAPFPRVGWE